MSRAIVIGSSPQLLVDAIGLARAGWDVEVVEGRDRLGGAWAVTDFAGWTNVELACHLIEREAVAYDLLTSLGVTLAPMDPAPETRPSPSVRLSYVSPVAAAAQLAWYPMARTSAVVRGPKQPRGRWRSRRRLHVKEFGDALRDRTPVMGVVGGAGALVATLAGVAETEGVAISTGTRVDRVEVTTDGGTVVHRIDRSDRAELVVLSAAFLPHRLRIDRVLVEGPVRRRSYAHFLLAFPEGAVTPHSYVRFPRDPVLQRSSEVTRAAVTRSAGPDGQVLLVSVRCDDEGAPLVGVDAVVARLRRHRLIDPSAEPTASELHRYEGRDGHATLAAATAGHPSVRLHRSFGDLSRCLLDAPAVPAPFAVRAER